MKTSGDRGVRGGDKSRWVKEIEEALLDGRADLAVHSAKDVPGELPDGLSIVGVPERADARDAVCGAAGVAAIPEGAVVGTSSLRRRSQLLALRPDLAVEDMRGNVDTRLRKLRERQYDAIVLARAGLDRLGVDEGEPVEVGDAHARARPGLPRARGARDDEEIARARRGGHRPARAVELTAERAVVTALDATCHTPVGAHARLDGDAARRRRLRRAARRLGLDPRPRRGRRERSVGARPRARPSGCSRPARAPCSRRPKPA